jgi:ATP-dependent DNA helicase RecG
MDLLDALRRPEGKTLEFKRDLSSPDGLLRTVVAFANSAGGTVLVGVEDGTRHVRGVRKRVPTFASARPIAGRTLH